MASHKRRRWIILTGLILSLLALSQGFHTQDKSDVEISDSTFKCISKMTKVRGFYVDNVLGDLDGTLKVANSKTGGVYPPGSVIQLVPTEVMVKHREGWNKDTHDWEFFELNVSPAGSTIKVRGVTEVKNRFGGNCFSCHVKARPEWDMICETDHGCAPIPLTAEAIAKIQQGDPRCTK
ncbi:MAG TPA: hypothetical protein VEZ90_14760 [Blastocatellia bacterium]|nr:hypothetical protein [Blastocatellia bacterium]